MVFPKWVYWRTYIVEPTYIKKRVLCPRVVLCSIARRERMGMDGRRTLGAVGASVSYIFETVGYRADG